TDGVGVVETTAGRIRCREREGSARGGDVLVAVRPEALRLGRAPDGAAAENVLSGTVRARAYLGNLFDYRVEVGGETLRVQGHVKQPFAVGDRVALYFAAEDAWAIPAARGTPGAGGG
ncbi:MAG: TOBE domain-containing protein, partial [Armatimonadetes bacterium]|nr:TOBE domain-containing protein [Armatimonadota bacterium]